MTTESTVFTGKSRKIQILSRELAETATGEVPYAVISMVNSDAEEAILAESFCRVSVLRLQFDAIEEPEDDLILFDARMADQILEFYAATCDEVGLHIVHCERGINRSAAVGAALARIAGENDAWFFERFDPLQLVYDVMIARWRVRKMAA